ncbi:MAG TPA: DPP IV N-terminal domain-containing protein, partial [Prolixibacteraceae bacterium]|nr:DPP IV N-terminal domain-containing protein [Prolixibacteraceae bacterium]
MKYILLSILLLFLFATNHAQNKKQLSLIDFIQGQTFKQESISGLKPMNDGLHYSTLVDDQRIVKYNYKTGDEIVDILNLNDIDNCPIESISDYTFSSNEERILLESNQQTIYRRSYTAEYYIWDNYTQQLYDLSEYGPQMVATFSPDGERVAFVRDNNIFVKTIRFGTEQQITFDGKKNEIINGIPDWVYEEEFGYNSALEWSPDSKMLAFVKFDESKVKEFSMPIYKGLSPQNNEYSLYPGQATFKYPKAGENNSIVSVHVYDIKTRTTVMANTGTE